MTDSSALAQFKEGIRLLRNGYSVEALEHLQRATELDQYNPYYLSFLGVAVARAQRKWTAAVNLCEIAVSLRRDEAQFYLNLAEVYVSAGRRDDAIAILDAGSIYCRTDARIKQLRGSLGRRNAPVLPFLERGHFLNSSLGKLRHRALGSLRKLQS